MYMHDRIGGKKRQLVGDLADLIRSGRLARGARLPGEHQLAEQYHVSRGTVRSALSELQQLELIATHAGVGSFVTFDGVPLDQGVGWARAFADQGSPVTTELLGITRAENPELTTEFGLVSVRRLRRDEKGRGVSLEEAFVPAQGILAHLPETGLVDGSLTASLRAAGLHPVGGDQWIGTEALGTEDAELLHREPGEVFLKTKMTSLDSGGGLVEHVVSLLDPARFQFHLTFGSR